MSVTSKFASQLASQPGLQVATIASGCFWGSEHIYRKYYLDKGVIDTEVGYTGGKSSNPTYREVCSSNTNHAEAVQILYDPQQVSYETLVDFFFKTHDPTTLNSQGPDRGTQYRSAIFTHDDEQAATAKQVRDKLQNSFWRDQIVTEITPIGKWWNAEEYHQVYLDHNPNGYQCPTHFLRTEPEK